MAQIQSGAGADLLTIHPTAKAARALLYASDGSVISRANGDARALTDQGLPMAGLNDDNFRLIRTDRLGNILNGNTNFLLSEPFEGTNLSIPNRWVQALTTFTMAQTAAGGINFNNGAVTTAAAGSSLISIKQFPKYQRAPLHAKFRARAGHVTNAVIEMGFGSPAAVTASPTVGAYFQITAAGVIQGVLTFNGVDQTTSPITLPGGWQSNFYTWDIILDDDEVVFFIQDTSSGLILAERRIQLAVTGPRLWNVSHLPVFGRLHFPTAPASAATLIWSSVDVVMLDVVMNKPWGHVLANSGYGGEINPTSSLQNANYSNSAAPASATLSNTAAGYTTLGGQFQFAAPAGAETDFALFGFTVPAPYSFVLTGVDISTFNMGAAVATTPHLLQWFVSSDQTVISLATASNRRTTLGSQMLAVGAAIGAMADRDISRDFSAAPLVTHGTRILVIGLKIPVGTATASQIIRGTVAAKGYFE